jgi:TolA-binding protein
VTKADLVAYWKLDETARTTVTDSSGNGHNGTLVGGLSFDSSSVEGVIDKALHLTGAKGASIHADSVSVPTSAFTFSLWFNPDSDQDSSSDKWYLMCWGGDEEPFGEKPLYEFNEDERGTLRLCIGIVGKEQYKLETKTNSWKAFTWYHLVATFDGTDVKLYVNGALEDSANQPGTHHASSKVCFGSKYDGEHPFEGRLDDIRIYSHALTADEITGLYRVYPALHTLRSDVAEAEDIIQQKPKEAIVFLEKKITELEKWREKNPNRNRLYAKQISKEISFDLYFELAKAKKAAGFASKDVDAAYERLIELGIRHSSNEGTKAEGMIDQNGPLGRVVRQTCSECKVKNDWPRTQRLLDTVFAGVKNPGPWAIFVESCLDDKSSECQKRFSEYLDNNPGLKVERDRTLAERYVATEKYLEAAQLYQILVNSGDSKDDKGLFEFQLCKNLFLAGQYRDAIPQLETFVANDKDIAQSKVIRAMVMKFQCHSKLGEFDKAASACFNAMMEYPEAEEMPEIIFCMGYCHMLLRDFEQAADALNVVVQDYPESAYASKARNHLMRIKTMTE